MNTPPPSNRNRVRYGLYLELGGDIDNISVHLYKYLFTYSFCLSIYIQFKAENFVFKELLCDIAS